jgi:hypothetical protein
VAQLSEWLKIMLGEISRKGEEQARAAAESRARAAESQRAPAAPPAAAPTEAR